MAGDRKKYKERVRLSNRERDIEEKKAVYSNRDRK